MIFSRNQPLDAVYKQAKRTAKLYHGFISVLVAGIGLAKQGGLQPGQAEAAFVHAGIPEELVKEAVEVVYGEEDPLS